MTYRRMCESLCWLCLPIVFAFCAVGCDDEPTPSESEIIGRVHYDLNLNGNVDDSRSTGLGGVIIDVGSGAASECRLTSEDLTGAFTCSVEQGTYTVELDAASLPPFFQPTSNTSLTATVSSGSVVELVFAVGNPVGNNVPDSYVAFGDSITYGVGGTNEEGYRVMLQDRLASYFGDAAIYNAAIPGAKAGDGTPVIDALLTTYQPAYVLLLFGTNDINDPAHCGPNHDSWDCRTVEHLTTMIRSSQVRSTDAVVGTIPPFADGTAGVYIEELNANIRAMASAEGALLADFHAAFMAHQDWPSLFSDRLHPNDEGYRVMAEVLFETLTGGRATSSTSTSLYRVPGRQHVYLGPSLSPRLPDPEILAPRTR